MSDVKNTGGELLRSFGQEKMPVNELGTDEFSVARTYADGAIVRVRRPYISYREMRVRVGWERLADVFAQVAIDLDEECRDKFFRRIIDRYAEALDKVAGGQE